MIEWMWIAQTAAQPAWMGLVPFVLIFLVFYFLLIRPTTQKQKALEQLVEALKKGDKVITHGGFYGEVVRTEEDTVILKIAENVKVKVAKRAIGGLAAAPNENGGK